MASERHVEGHNKSTMPRLASSKHLTHVENRDAGPEYPGL
jgi:hypothetical protein